jgi:hypothetical protein
MERLSKSVLKKKKERKERLGVCLGVGHCLVNTRP